MAKSIEMILATALGERQMRFDFGSALPQMIFQPITSSTLVEIEESARQALLNWERRIVVRTLSAEVDPDVESKVNLTITYDIPRTNTRGNLVFPFYLREPDPCRSCPESRQPQVRRHRHRDPAPHPTFTPVDRPQRQRPRDDVAQLFAFMSEQLLFQINQVPNKGLVTFLQMVGVGLHPASPAVADVTLSLKSTSPRRRTPSTSRPRTGVLTSGPPPGQKTPVRFETQIPFMLVNGDVVDLISIDCSREVTSFAAVNTQAPNHLLRSDGPGGRGVLPGVRPQRAGRQRGRPGRSACAANAAGSTDVGEPPNDVTQPDAGPRLVWSFGSGANSSSGVDVLTFTDFTPSEDSTGELIRSGYLEFTFQDQVAANAFVRASSTDDITQFQNKFVIRSRLARPGAFADVGLPSIATIASTPCPPAPSRR